MTTETFNTLPGRTFREACEAGDFYRYVEVDAPHREGEMPGCPGVEATLMGVAQGNARGWRGTKPIRRVRLWLHGRTSSIGAALLVEDAGEHDVPELPALGA